MKVANTEENKWMLPIELESINRGLTFCQKKYYDNATCTGYLNADGQREGAGVTILTTG